MPTAKNATTTTITSRIRSVPIEVPLVHAKSGAGAMIGLQAQHTQGACPMKDDAIRPGFQAPRDQASHRWRTPRLAALALLLPLAMGSTAQTSLRWQPWPPAKRLATGVTPPR